MLAGSPPGGKSLKPKLAAAIPLNLRKSRRVSSECIICRLFFYKTPYLHTKFALHNHSINGKIVQMGGGEVKTQNLVFVIGKIPNSKQLNGKIAYQECTIGI